MIVNFRKIYFNYFPIWQNNLITAPLTFHYKKNSAPSRKSMLKVKGPSVLNIPKTLTKSFGARSFQVAKAELWNEKPDVVK